MAWMLSLKVVLISTAVLCMALGLKVSIPLVVEFSASFLSVAWNFCLLCFKPPYLYVIINGIIITIAACSRLHHHSAAVDDQLGPTPPRKVPSYEMRPPPYVRSELTVSEPLIGYEPKEEPPILEVRAVVVNGLQPVEDEEDQKAIDDLLESTWTPLKRIDSTENIPLDYLSPTEKPLVSARFGHQEPLRASPEGGRALSAAKPRQHETLENTWKANTGGRPMSLCGHMQKCDTWENRVRDVSVGPLEATPVKKSETFRDRTNQPASPSAMAGAKLREEPWLSQEELNRRVEAFIRKFNEEMRLQRQESLNQYMELIDRGSHQSVQVRDVSVGPLEATPVKKSETFRDRTNQPASPSAMAGAKLREEPWLSQEELNRRVEAFIRKCK